MDGSQNSRPRSKMDIIVKNVLTSLGSTERRAECKSDFSNLKTDQERVKFAITLARMEKMLSLSLLPDPIMKTVSGAEDYRKMGNGLYCGPDMYNKLDKIIAYYTQSITLAPQKSEALALGYANRSAVLFDARVYRDCLQDIARALELPYPDHLKTKIYIRQARCLMVLRKSTDEYKDEIGDALKAAYEYLSSVPLGSESRRKLEEIMELEDITPTKREFNKWQDTALMPSVADENPELKGVSSALEIKYDQINGRHTVAARDIDPGEVLAVLKPYAAVLTRGKKFTHCAYCMEQTWSSLPCETCCEVVYCGESCKSRAYEEYHDIECQVMRYLSPSDITVHVLFGIRLLVKAFKEAGSIQALRNKIKEIESCTDPIKMGFTQGRLDGESYAGVYTLITNTEKRSFEKLFTVAVHASFAVLSLATKTKLFGQNLEAEVDSFEGNDDVTFIGGLIMRHMLIVDHNAHCLLDVDDSLTQLKRGAVVLAFSQMNHSCNFPGIVKSSYGMNMVYHSNFAIKKGEQVYDNYGFPFDFMERTKRRAQLKEKYCFDCDCIACSENWPLYDELELTRPDLDDESQQNLSEMIDNLTNLRIVPDQSVHITKLKDTIAELNAMIILLDEKGVKMPCPGLIKVITTRNQLLLRLANRSQSLNYM